jgi:hypothetical protein
MTKQSSRIDPEIVELLFWFCALTLLFVILVLMQR